MAPHSFNVYLNLNSTYYNYTKLLYSTNVELSIMYICTYKSSGAVNQPLNIYFLKYIKYNI